MGLPWVRLDANIASHDKILAALHTRGGKAAIAVYLFSLSWSGGQGTDGHIPAYALPMIHATRPDIAILVDTGLWHPNGDGWDIHNYAKRQETRAASEAKREQARAAANARWKATRLRAVKP